MRRPKNPGARAHLARTPAQETAFKAFRLRGLWWALYALSEPRRSAAQRLVDAELVAIGHEPQTERRLRHIREQEAATAAATRERFLLEEELPF